ncbi:MAG: DUF4139 domain-containing protein [Spirochaetota bacterium]
MFILLISFIFLLFPLYAQQRHVLHSNITAVKVYEGAAFVQRQGILRTSVTRNGHFILDGFPEKLQDKSISLKFLGAKGKIWVTRLQVSQEIQAKNADTKLRKAKQEYDSLSRRLNLLNEEYEVLENSGKVVQNLTPIRRKPDSRSYNDIVLNPAAWNSYRAMVKNLLSNNNREKFSLLQKIDRLNERLVVAEAKLNFYRSRSTKVTKMIRIDYSTQIAKSYRFQLEYLISGAEWYPRYTVQTNAKQASNELSIFAVVRNLTGEDWSGVALSFSAADYRGSLDLPELSEWRFGEREIPQQVVAEDADTYYQEEPVQQTRSSARRRRRDSRIIDSLDKSKLPSDREQAREEGRIAGGISRKPLSAVSKKAKKFSYGSLQSQRQERARNYLNQNLAKANSLETERKITTLNEHFLQQKQSYSKRNYAQAIRYGQLAQKKLNTLTPNLRKELRDAELHIRKLNRKAAIEKENLKLLKTLVPPRKSSGGFNHLYLAKKKYSVRSDESFHRIHIKSQKLAAEVRYESSPLTSKNVYITSVTKLRKNEPLLEGPLDIFFLDNYVGSSRIKMTSRTEPLQFPLGVEKDIEIDRKESSYREKKGFFTSAKVIRKTILITIRNRKSYPVKVRFIERLPYTNDDKVKVVMEKTSVPTKKILRGLVEAKIRIPSKKRKVWKYSYSVTYPQDSILREYIRTGESK